MFQAQPTTNKSTRIHRLLPLLSGALVVAVLAGAVLISIAARAGVRAASAAIQAKAPTYWSFYMHSASTSEARTLGCNQAHAQASHKTSGTVVLDFGGQWSNGGGTEMINTVLISNGRIEAVTEAFSAGFKSCIGKSKTILHLGIGTNNSIQSSVTYANGRTWAHVVAAIQSYNKSKKYYPQVLMYGANDIEPSWSSASAAIAWVKGFASVPGYHYFDFGSADGCPTDSSNNTILCNNGWNQYDVWYVSWGAQPALATPEIYNQAMADQWAMLSLYGAQHQGGRIVIWGPWDESDLASDFTATQAWDALWLAVHSHRATAQNFGYSLEINNEP
jgi:hypothetical protein